ncbi:MAG: acylphosphatase [Candidatus Methylacidiphilales bacterium]
MIAKTIFYEGHVQGVGFRYSVKQLAAGFDVSGTVENLPDGRVRLDIQGENHEVQALVDEIDRSHLNGLIKKKEIIASVWDDQKKGFHITR